MKVSAKLLEDIYRMYYMEGRTANEIRSALNLSAQEFLHLPKKLDLSVEFFGHLQQKDALTEIRDIERELFATIEKLHDPTNTDEANYKLNKRVASLQDRYVRFKLP